VRESVSESVSIDGGFAAGSCGMAKRLRHQCAYRRQQYFHHAQSTACAPKACDEEIVSVSAPRERNSSGEGLETLCLRDVIVAWKRVDEMSKMKSSHGGNVRAI
jgi:hypothetical protein